MNYWPKSTTKLLEFSISEILENDEFIYKQ